VVLEIRVVVVGTVECTFLCMNSHSLSCTRLPQQYSCLNNCLFLSMYAAGHAITLAVLTIQDSLFLTTQ
jgi:hypothetical protein